MRYFSKKKLEKRRRRNTKKIWRNTWQIKLFVLKIFIAGKYNNFFYLPIYIHICGDDDKTQIKWHMIVFQLFSFEPFQCQVMEGGWMEHLLCFVKFIQNMMDLVRDVWCRETLNNWRRANGMKLCPLGDLQLTKVTTLETASKMMDF